MAEQKRKLVMDIVAPPLAPSPPTKKKRDWEHLKHMLHISLANRRPLYILGTVATLAVAVILVSRHSAAHKPRIEDTSNFPASTIHQITGFKFYYLKPSFQTDFVLERNTIHIQSGVLVFEMKNPTDKTLAFTEERTPPNYDVTGLRADRQFNTEYGQGFVSENLTNTTGALFTQDNTWLLINAPQSIGPDLMEQILTSLTPDGK